MKAKIFFTEVRRKKKHEKNRLKQKLTQQNVELSRHTSRNGVNPESYVKSSFLKGFYHVSNGVLSFSYSQSIARGDYDILSGGKQFYSTVGIDFCVATCYLLSCSCAYENKQNTKLSWGIVALMGWESSCRKLK